VALNGASHGPVLVGFAGALAAPEAAASLLAAGIHVAAFAPRGSRPALRRDKRVRIEHITAPEQDSAAAARELVELTHATGAVALMPLDDASLWLCDRIAGEVGVPIIGPTGTQARLALDKSLQLELARRAGLAVPATAAWSTRDELLAVDAFPAIVKPALAIEQHGGRLVRGAGRVCADADELRAIVGEIGDGPTLVQPWIRGTGEGLFGIAVDGEIVHPSAHRRLRMLNPQGSGSSACVSIAPDPALVAAGGRLLREARWTGLFMLEFLRDGDGTAWFMELNGRAWGSLALSRRLGLEYPAWAAREVLGLGAPPATVVRTDTPVVCRHLGREIVHVLTVIRGPRSAALEDWPSRWGTVRAVARVRRGERWYNWSRRRPGVFVDDTLRTVLEPVRKMVSR
jgi:predicted ATP-grasp superfamily ATP-dependent carboligase